MRYNYSIKCYNSRLLNEFKRKQHLMYPQKGYNNVMWEQPGPDYKPDEVFENPKKKILSPRKSKTNLSLFG